jgi:hypothetical protein
LSETDDVLEATISGSSLRFSDSAGRRWDLALALDVLKGLGVRRKGPSAARCP